MALAAAARSRRLSEHLASRLHPALPHLLTSLGSGDPPTASPLLPAPGFRSLQFLLPQSAGATQSRSPALLPFGIHLAGAGPPPRSFSSLPSYRMADAGRVPTDVASAPAAVSFPSEVAWIAEDSSLSVAAVQHLIASVHSFTGLNWGLSIGISTVLLRCVLITLSIHAQKQAFAMGQELSDIKKLIDSANDDKSREEAIQRSLSVLKRLSVPTFIMILTPYTFMALYFAISNMVEKLPSLKDGGALWFTDLTTPDALYIFPALTAMFLMLKLEFSQHYSKTPRSKEADVMKSFCILSFPLAAFLPQAICSYFVAWSFTSLTQIIVLNQPVVKKLLNGERINPACPSSDGPKETAAEDSSSPIKGHEQPVSSERREDSDSSVLQVPDQSDKKSEKDC